MSTRIFLFLFFLHQLLVLVLGANSSRLHERQRTRPVFDVRKAPGGTARLKCKASGRRSNIKWQKEGKFLVSSSKFRIKSGGKTLRILRLAVQDTGLYRCLNAERKEVLGEFNVSLALPSKPTNSSFLSKNDILFLHPRDMQNSKYVGSVGTTLLLPCEAKGRGSINYTWYKNGKVLKKRQDSDKLSTSTPVLKIKQLIFSDAGNYTCVATNGFKNITVNFDVSVLDPQHVFKVRNTVGESAKLSCKVPLAVDQMYWQKDRKFLVTSSRFRIKSGGKVLRILKLVLKDKGRYLCIDAKTKNILCEFNLFVNLGTLPPFTKDDIVFLRPLSMQRAQYNVRPVGSGLRLPCEAQGQGPVKYTWYKNGKLLKERRLDNKLNASAPLLKLKELVLSDIGNYTCVASNGIKNISFKFEVSILEKVRSKPILQNGFPRNKTVVVGQNVTLGCYELISSTIPDFRWIHWPVLPPLKELYKVLASGNLSSTPYSSTLIDPIFHESIVKKVKRTHYGVKVHLYNVTKKDEGFYTCLVSNHIGADYTYAHLSVLSEDEIRKKNMPQVLNTYKTYNSRNNKTVEQTVIIVLVVAVVFIAVMLSVFFYRGFLKNRKSRKQKKNDRSDTTKNHGEQMPFVDNNLNSKEPLTGISRVRLLSSLSGNSAEPLLRGQLRNSSVRSGMSDLFSIRSGQSLPPTPEYGDVFDFPIDEAWEIDRSQLIFGETLGEGAFGVVIKAEGIGLRGCQPRSTVAVKKLKADATDNELLDLLSEVETMKQMGEHKNVIKLIGCCAKDGPLYVVVEYACHGNLRNFLRKNRPPIPEFIGGELIRPQQLLSTQTLVSFALQIAKGMEFLASKKCIHRDLAARNILVAEDNVMKIADFGLARSIREAEYYRKTTDGRLPVKWLAIEALFDRVYTTQSDAWAYGVLLWEIFTLGGSPYPGIPVQRLFDLLKSGHRMVKPQGCPQCMYEIMLKCWLENPNRRPTFTMLVHELEYLLEEMTSAEYVEVLGHSVSSLNGTDGSEDVEDADIEDDFGTPMSITDSISGVAEMPEEEPSIATSIFQEDKIFPKTPEVMDAITKTRRPLTVESQF